MFLTLKTVHSGNTHTYIHFFVLRTLISTMAILKVWGVVLAPKIHGKFVMRLRRLSNFPEI